MAPARAASPVASAIKVHKPQPPTQPQPSKVLTLWVHENTSTFANHDCVVNPEFLPNIRPRQVLRLSLSKGSQQQQQLASGSPAQTQHQKQQQQTQAQTDRSPSLTEPIIVQVAEVDKSQIEKKLQVGIRYYYDISTPFVITDWTRSYFRYHCIKIWPTSSYGVRAWKWLWNQ
jgi:hypothetical protein